MLYMTKKVLKTLTLATITAVAWIIFAIPTLCILVYDHIRRSIWSRKVNNLKHSGGTLEDMINNCSRVVSAADLFGDDDDDDIEITTREVDIDELFAESDPEFLARLKAAEEKVGA